MHKSIVGSYARPCWIVVIAVLSMVGTWVRAQSLPNPDALLAIDRSRISVIERIVAEWGPTLAKSLDYVSVDDLRTRLMTLRADALLAASLAGTEKGLREVTGLLSAVSKISATQIKALGDTSINVVYTPVTPCRLVETRGTFAAVYQGDGTPAHTADPFAPNEIRTYAIQGGNGVCLTQLPAGLNPAAVQLQVFGLPTTSASGDIEILPQGSTFGSTATMVYVGTIAFNTVSTAAKINPANNEISVQVRGGGANLAMDVVGYFAAPSGNGGKFFRQGGNAFGATATLGTADNQPLELYSNNVRVMRYEPGNGGGPNLTGGDENNVASGGGATVAGGGSAGGCSEVISGISRSCTNQATGSDAFVGSGLGNLASADESTVDGGLLNTASGDESAVLGGLANTASGSWATVAGGTDNVAQMDFTFAAGHRAKATTKGSFIWADSQEFDFQPSVANFFGVRATGGVGFTVAINPTNGAVTQFCNLLPGTPSWQCTSDRDAKENIAPVDGEAVLAHVVAMPISTWNFKGADPSLRALGPMAQDFYAEFHLGNDNKSIATSNLAGVALAAIQGLQHEVQEKKARIDALEREQHATATEMAKLRQKVEDLIARLR